MYSKFHRLPRAWLETFGDRAPLKRNSIFELAWIGEGITSAARETRLKEEEEGNSRWRGIERRKGYFFLLNFTKGAPMTLTIAIPVCVSCEMGNERQTSTMSFHYFSSSSSFSLLRISLRGSRIDARCIQNFVAPDLFFSKESRESYYISRPRRKFCKNAVAIRHLQIQ